MPDAVFADRRLAAIYDDIDGDRSDLDAYEAIVVELGARSVLDLGCGTGDRRWSRYERLLDAVDLTEYAGTHARVGAFSPAIVARV